MTCKNTFRFNAYDEAWTVSLVRTKYINGGTAIQIINDNGEPFGLLTVNIIPLPDNMACIDTNNNPWELVDELTRAGVFTYTGRAATSGFCEYPVVEFDEEWLNSI